MSPENEVRRLVDWLGMRVLAADGRRLGLVNDLRLAPTGRVGLSAELVVEGIVVDGRHAGSMLGYDRRRDQGPWLVRRPVRALHRHAGYAPWSAVEAVDLDAGEIRTSLLGLHSLGMRSTTQQS